MTYRYREEDERFCIWNTETRSNIGYVSRQGENWRVEDGDNVFVAMVSSRNDAGPILADYYATARKWYPEDMNENSYAMWTEFGCLLAQEVEKQPGCWLACRMGEQYLVRGNETAIFPNLEEAQRAAYAHRSDGSAGSAVATDGLSWFMPEKINELGHWPELNSKVTN